MSDHEIIQKNNELIKLYDESNFEIIYFSQKEARCYLKQINVNQCVKCKSLLDKNKRKINEIKINKEILNSWEGYHYYDDKIKIKQTICEKCKMSQIRLILIKIQNMFIKKQEIKLVFCSCCGEITKSIKRNEIKDKIIKIIPDREYIKCDACKERIEKREKKWKLIKRRRKLKKRCKKAEIIIKEYLKQIERCKK